MNGTKDDYIIEETFTNVSIKVLGSIALSTFPGGTIPGFLMYLDALKDGGKLLARIVHELTK